MPASLLSAMDFTLEVCREKIPDCGEDSYFYSVGLRAALVSVFDGCGGSGARKYERYRGKSGAYMASRAAAGAVKDWFEEGPEQDVSRLKKRLERYLALCKKVGGGSSGIRGTMARDFPTTAAILTCTANDRSLLDLRCLWAGDSRCYLLDEDGLKQLTEDDLGGIDPMENLTADGVLTNVISASKAFDIHCKELSVQTPCFLFAASDGCFGYLSTPMEFEYLLLETLLRSASPTQWEDALDTFWNEIAGDDYTICGMCIGFGSFAELKRRMKPRTEFLYTQYIQGIREKTPEGKTSLWHHYRQDYSKYL